MPLHLIQTSTGDKYFDGDLDALVKYQEDASKSLKHKINYSLDLQLYPEPFAGNANAKVYLLSGNPGLGSPGLDDRLMTSNQPLWDRMMRLSYNPIPSIGHTPTMYWLDLYWKNTIERLPCGYDGGFNWWEKRTNYLRNKESIADLHEKLFNIDYHPYHSKNIKIDKNIQSLPSTNVVNDILQQAFDDKDRLFIIVRCRNAWVNRLLSILKVKDLPENVIKLSNPRCAYLTPGNMETSDWRKLLSVLK